MPSHTLLAPRSHYFPQLGCLPALPGFGTLLATALIHMLLPAVEALGNPCLAPFWREAYEAWPYLFVLVAILAMQLIDFAIKAATTGSARSAGTAHDAPHGSHAHVHSEHSAAGGCGHAAVIGAIAAASGSGPAKDAEAGEAGEGQPNTEEGQWCWAAAAPLASH